MICQKKSIRMGSKFWYYCASETGYFYQFDLYLGNKEIAKKKIWDKVLFWKWMNPFKVVTVCFFIIFSTAPYL